LLRGRPVARLDAGPLADPFVGGVDRADDRAVGHDLGGPVATDAGDPGMVEDVRDAERGHDCDPWGCRRRSGWPGETGSPSSTSHSTIVPAWSACTSRVSRREEIRATTSPAGTSVPGGFVGIATVPLTGAVTIRHVGALASRAEPCSRTISRAFSRSSGLLRASVSTPLSPRLVSPVRAPAG